MLVIHNDKGIWIARMIRAGHKWIEDKAERVKCRSYEGEGVGEYLKTWSVKKIENHSMDVIYSCEDLLDIF